MINHRDRCSHAENFKVKKGHAVNENALSALDEGWENKVTAAHRKFASKSLKRYGIPRICKC